MSSRARYCTLQLPILITSQSFTPTSVMTSFVKNDVRICHFRVTKLYMPSYRKDNNHIIQVLVNKTQDIGIPPNTNLMSVTLPESPV